MAVIVFKAGSFGTTSVMAVRIVVNNGFYREFLVMD